MRKYIKLSLYISCFLILPSIAYAWDWSDLWQTSDQQAAKLLQQGKAAEAARLFKNNDWHAVALYRSGNYKRAFQQFKQTQSSDAQYNAGNAAAFTGDYQKAINAYNKALAINPDNQDAITNRDIIKKLMDKKKKQENDTASNNKKNKNQKNNDNTNKNENSDANSSPQNLAQNNTQQQATDKNSNGKNTKEKNANNQQAQNQPTQGEEKNSKKLAGNQKSQNRSQDNASDYDSNLQNQDENKKQILRRLAEDPGGLLRQKFMRDYLRRHAVEQEPNQGDL